MAKMRISPELKKLIEKYRCVKDTEGMSPAIRDVKSFGEEVCEYGFYNQGAMRSTNSSQLKNAQDILFMEVTEEE